MAESSSSCHIQPDSYSTWMIATAVSSSYGISGPTCNHLLANLAPSCTLNTPPPFWSSGWSLHPSWRSQYRPWQMWFLNLGCNLSHAMNNIIDPEGWTSVHMECHGMPWNVGHHLHCWSNTDLPDKSSFCFQIFHLHVTCTRTSPYNKCLGWHHVWHHVWLKGILWILW